MKNNWINTSWETLKLYNLWKNDSTAEQQFLQQLNMLRNIFFLLACQSLILGSTDASGLIFFNLHVLVCFWICLCNDCSKILKTFLIQIFVILKLEENLVCKWFQNFKCVEMISKWLAKSLFRILFLNRFGLVWVWRLAAFKLVDF